jgi:hypothetical protein
MKDCECMPLVPMFSRICVQYLTDQHLLVQIADVYEYIKGRDLVKDRIVLGMSSAASLIMNKLKIIANLTTNKPCAPIFGHTCFSKNYAGYLQKHSISIYGNSTTKFF